MVTERTIPFSSASWPLPALAGRARQGGVWSPVTLTHSHNTSREKHMRTKVGPLKSTRSLTHFLEVKKAPMCVI